MASPARYLPGPAPCLPQSPPERPLQVKVVGLFKSSSFQIAKSTAESLKNTHPSKFEDPIIVPLQEFAWDQYLQEKKRELKGETWEYSSYVMCFINDQLLGKAGFSARGIRLHYKGSIFHRIVRNGWIQGGDIEAGKGDGGESIFGATFEDENFSIPHNKRGILGMVNKGRHSNGSQFYITLQPAPYLDRKYVAFGQLIEGTEVLKQLELIPTENERPVQKCLIFDSGDLFA
ncbi:probable inactive peptidyl-prolyl cis-trans isomerase-like 6 isoform X2 [Choloepus didactylus]|uniref:probable inactive peptidyl-prolyl cis-trans isomerase-like 6 isoform X2 n=1 Tax=Choloepus didactylus TaxID=27675 RepID=UPI00189E2C42|nr:probable inactive peptidyl-prolyl cis-trans isomerase-like 6 isoform X2 [Choloepus didactylus]